MPGSLIPPVVPAVSGSSLAPATDVPTVVLDEALTAADLEAIARGGARVAIGAGARERIVAAAAALQRAADAGTAVYGLTTGLGARVTEPVPEADRPELARRTIRGRATAVGPPLPRELVRAAMAVRAAGLCAGGSGTGPELAEALVGLLNAGVHPRVPGSGSVGEADLCLMAHVGLGLLGEGEAEHEGEVLPAAEALARAGLAPLPLAPRDGLAVCSSSAVSIGAATLALLDGERTLDAVQASAALAMEGFRANPTPLDPRAIAARPAPGQAWAAAGLRGLLAGGELTVAEHPPRRLQDPLSYRTAAPVHGALHAALAGLAAALAPELAGAADNPLVVVAPDAVLPTGNFASPALALALDAAALGVAQVAHGVAERTARLGEPRLSGLRSGLAPEGPARAGLAPLSKTAHALVLEIRALAAPVSIHGMVLADGVEDDTTGALQAARRLDAQLAKLELLAALELLVAAQAVDAAGIAPAQLGAGTRIAHRAVRELVPPIGEDRPLGAEVQRVRDGLVARGRLVARIAEAIA